MYRNLFKICGFSDKDITQNKERIEKVLSRIGVTNEAHIRHAETVTRSNFEIELDGV